MSPRQSQWLIPPRICLLFRWMDGVRPASADLSIDKARTAARLQRSTAEIEDNVHQGRTAFVTAGILVLRVGVPIRVNGAVGGAVGVAGLSKEIEAEIANTAAAALSPSPMTAQCRLRAPTCVFRINASGQPSDRIVPAPIVGRKALAIVAIRTIQMMASARAPSSTNKRISSLTTSLTVCPA